MVPIIAESEEIKKILTSSLKTAQEHPDRRGFDEEEDFSLK
jgi:hypothetical protein